MSLQSLPWLIKTDIFCLLTVQEILNICQTKMVNSQDSSYISHISLKNRFWIVYYSIRPYQYIKFGIKHSIPPFKLKHDIQIADQVLCQATKCGNDLALQQALNQKVDYLPSTLGLAFYKAIKYRNESTVKILIKHGAHLNQSAEMRQKNLIQAVRQGSENLTNFLLESPDFMDFYQESYNFRRDLLSIAAQEGHIDLIQLLLNHDLLLNGYLMSPNYYMPLVLKLAVENNHINIVEFLLNPPQVGINIPQVIRQFDWQRSRSRELPMAVRRGNINIVKLLLYGSIKTTTQNESPGWGEIELSINDRKKLLNSATQENHTPIVTFFLNQGYNINWILTSSVLSVVKSGNNDLFQFLTTREYKLYQLDCVSQLPRFFLFLTWAIENRHLNMVDAIWVLIQSLLPQHTITEWLDKSLIYSIREGLITSFMNLIQIGANIHTTGWSGYPDSALYEAAGQNRIEIIKILLAPEKYGLSLGNQQGLDIHAADRRGSDTALRRAAKNGHTETVDLLLHPQKYGIDIGGAYAQAADCIGSCAALREAQRYKHSAVTNLLLPHIPIQVRSRTENRSTLLNYLTHLRR